MGLSQRLAVGAHGLVCVATVTALLSPVSLSVERSWAFPVLFVVAHVALGVAVRRRWALAGPAALSLAVFVAGGAAGLAWTVLLVGMPALMGLTALGWLVGRAAGPRRGVVLGGLLAVALVPVGWGVVEIGRRGPHVPPAVQARLPVRLSLGNLCPGSETPPRMERDLRRRAEVLLRELRRRPDELVTYTYHYEDRDDERLDITVRELARSSSLTWTRRAATSSWSAACAWRRRRRRYRGSTLSRARTASSWWSSTSKMPAFVARNEMVTGRPGCVSRSTS